MHLLYQPERDREVVVLEPTDAVLQRAYVVADLPDVVSLRLAGDGSVEDLRDRGLGAFDPRARNGLAGNVGIHQQAGVEEQSAGAGQPAERGVRLGEPQDGVRAERKLSG